MMRWSPYLNYWLARLGPRFLLGLGMAVLALALYLGLGLPAERRLYQLQSETSQAKDHENQLRRLQTMQSPQAAVSLFYQSLPARNEAPDLLEKIFDAAYELNLSPEQGEFRLVKEQDAAFLRYQVSLPVQGGYPDIRKFVNTVLEQIPAASLDSISFNREDVKKTEVEANVHFTLYLGAGK